MLSAIEKRKSIRKFQNKKVEPEKIDQILRAAMQAPSGMDGFPWEFVVVDDPLVLKKLQGFSKGAHAMPTAPLLIIPLIKSIPIREKMNLQFMNYEDLGTCTENLWLQAIEEGLSASWMGVAPGSDHCDLISQILNLPNDVKPFSVMAIGYPAEDVDTTPVNRYDSSKIHYNIY